MGYCTAFLHAELKESRVSNLGKRNCKILIEKPLFAVLLRPITSSKSTCDKYNKAVTLWHLIINPLWPARNVLGWRFQQPQNYIWNLRFCFFHADGLILHSWPCEERDGLAGCSEHWTEGIHSTGSQQQPHSLHLPWFFSLSRFFVAGRNISISSGTFLITWTAHNAAC